MADLPVDDQGATDAGECVVHDHPVPPEEMARYSPERDPDLEQDIADYVEGQARDEEVKHVEMIKTEIVLGERYEIWDVTTDKNRWWVLTNMTNLYSQQHFPSLDYTLSFHIGLMMRLRSRSAREGDVDPHPFDEVFRRQEQARDRYEAAIEAEDFQAVGMQLRECLLSLIGQMRRQVEIPEEIERPQEANFIAWSDVLLNKLCGGSSRKQLRQYLKRLATETWQLVNWLTHHRNANKMASTISVHACDTLIGHLVTVFMQEADDERQCPVCASRNIRSHYDIGIEPEGDYYETCGVCRWSSHPAAEQVAGAEANGVELPR